jgi:hypothetical protein
MSDSLTREQVEQFKQFSSGAVVVDIGGNLSAVRIPLAMELMIDTDAALRAQCAAQQARIAELEQQVNGQVRERALDLQACEQTVMSNLSLKNQLDGLKAKLAQVEQERDKLQRMVDHTIKYGA